MKEKEKRTKSAMPIYVSALTWLVFAVFIPMYRIENIGLAFASSIVIYILSRRFFADKVEYVEKFVTTGDKSADEVILKGRKLLEDLQKNNKKISDAKMKAQINLLFDYGNKILNFVQSDVSKISNIGMFMDYFLPTTIKLLNNYLELTKNKNETTALAKENIEKLVEKIVTNFKNELDGLYEDRAMDIKLEVAVMEEMIKREGLLKDGL
ncbi:MAG: 5-bromo-4-chloroindolyl phosphate hydrolysis family protein [Defluviitaleaceae bacterium]|nr:5-bromo-4-chloroindolyl phosphate hydrolysis family protein [Defluviitaleaceae bacterium]